MHFNLGCFYKNLNLFNYFKKKDFKAFKTHSLKGIGGCFEITLPLNPQLNPQNPF
ncbi:hypothetical protein predicted by Glimmer/Critica [Helicobacter acinonychis str. Sheeba]|uniref:Uncharacterized protein n=1 Tax=Helicobacter acinonychis (strain Sheeba) TaxID=382638 RepID=Q17XM8_HELAH|nr:hypothetical protein predicted by Glimmer/Critica [Helicobacter acinonychis str. Sheeba]